MDLIEVNGIRLYAYHGCLEEEAIIGQEYIVNVVIEADLEEAAKEDELSKTIDYVEVYEIVKKEMAVRAKLIETVGMRIAESIKSQWNEVDGVTVEVIKLHPPIPGDVEEVSISVTA